MKDVVNALQVAAVSLMVIPLGTERLKGRKARLEIVRYCRKNEIVILLANDLILFTPPQTIGMQI